MNQQSDSDESNEPLIFEAVLTPNRSLSPRGFVILMSILCAFSFAAGLGFFLAGAWPVVGFLGLDVLLVYIAFRINYRQGRGFETLQMTREALRVRRVDPWGRTSDWSFQPAWLQVLVEEDEHPTNRLSLRSRGKSLSIGNFLSPEERLELGQSLAQAVRKAKRAAEPG